MTTIRAQVRGLTGTTAAALGAPIAADDDRIVVAVDIANGAQILAAQPDVPRNLTATLTDANNSVTAATLTIVGKTPQGLTVTEVATLSQLKAGWVGKAIYHTIASATVSGVTGTVGAGADQLKVGVGNVIGLPAPISQASQVKAVSLGAVPVASPTVAIGQNTSGVDASAATYNGTKALVVWYNPFEG
jgi:hypothetical protein